MVRKWIRFSIHEAKRCEVWEWPIAGFLFETTSKSLALGVTVTTHALIGASATLQCRLPTRPNSFTCIKVSYLVLEMWPGSQILSMYFHANRCHGCVPFLFKLRLKRTTQLRNATGSAGTPGTAVLEHPVQCRSLSRLWLARPSPWMLDEWANFKLLDVAWGMCQVLEVAKSCHVLLHPILHLAALCLWQDIRIPTWCRMAFS